MDEKTTVGASSRTPFKHWLYNAYLGKVAGATSTGRAMGCNRLTIVDMCAGDGWDQDSIGSSPSIAIKHSAFLVSRGIQSNAYFYEKEEATYVRLMNRIDAKKIETGVDSIVAKHGTSENLTLSDFPITRSDSVFIYADPNSVATLPVTRQLVGSFNERTLFLLTLGCNANGIKRRTIDERRKWFDVAMMAIDSVRNHHDIHLIWLNRDSHQWAYLASVPKAWSRDLLSTALRVGNNPKKNLWQFGVDGLSLKFDGRKLVIEKLTELFLTAEELKKGVTV